MSIGTRCILSCFHPISSLRFFRTKFSYRTSRNLELPKIYQRQGHNWHRRIYISSLGFLLEIQKLVNLRKINNPIKIINNPRKRRMLSLLPFRRSLQKHPSRRFLPISSQQQLPQKQLVNLHRRIRNPFYLRSHHGRKSTPINILQLKRSLKTKLPRYRYRNCCQSQIF